MFGVVGVGHGDDVGLGAGSRFVIDNGKMGPDVVPEDPSRLEKVKALGKKSIVEGTLEARRIGTIGRIWRCRKFGGDRCYGLH